MIRNKIIHLIFLMILFISCKQKDSSSGHLNINGQRVDLNRNNINWYINHSKLKKDRKKTIMSNANVNVSIPLNNKSHIFTCTFLFTEHEIHFNKTYKIDRPTHSSDFTNIGIKIYVLPKKPIDDIKLLNKLKNANYCDLDLGNKRYYQLSYIQSFNIKFIRNANSMLVCFDLKSSDPTNDEFKINISDGFIKINNFFDNKIRIKNTKISYANKIFDGAKWNE